MTIAKINKISLWKPVDTDSEIMLWSNYCSASTFRGRIYYYCISVYCIIRKLPVVNFTPLIPHSLTRALPLDLTVGSAFIPPVCWRFCAYQWPRQVAS